MEVSQYNQSCQVFGTDLYPFTDVFNSTNRLIALYLFKLLYFTMLLFAYFVDISVDKTRFLLHTIDLDRIC